MDFDTPDGEDMRRRYCAGKQKTGVFGWKTAGNILFAGLSAIGMPVYADLPSGIIGGSTSDSAAYAAFVSLPDGGISPISNLPTATSIINGVAINDLGISLIGGQDSSGNGYAALLSSAGALTSLPLDLSSGSISAVSLNLAGQGLVGGSSDEAGYAALIAPDGTVSVLGSIPSGPVYGITSVSINSEGVGLIGGEGGGTFYAAYVAQDTTVTPVTGFAEDAGSIFGVSINDAGNGIVGGVNVDSSACYAAFVTIEGISNAIDTLSDTGGEINSVAINNDGLALLGGQDANNMYAGYATFGDATVTELLDATVPGEILSVAINSSGVGILGGEANSNLYAALVTPDTSLLSLFSDDISGQINSVAINEAGVGLIGGYSSTNTPYAALMAPNGILTALTLSNGNSILSVDINDLTNAATPQSIGPYASAIYTQLAAACALEFRFLQQNRNWMRKKGAALTLADVSDSELQLASNSDDLAAGRKPGSQRKKRPPASKQNTIWAAPFGNYTRLRNQGAAIPDYTNQIGGVLLGYDHHTDDYMVGGSLGYAFNYIHYSQHLGHGKLQEETANVYGSYSRDHFWLGGVIWGGLYQFSNERHTLSVITSKANSHGWILSPHLEMASPWAIDQKQRYFVEPFFMLDWVNSWQNHYTESGEAGFNLQMKGLYSSLLQSEAGLRFYERFAYGWGDFCLEEKVSYVNQAPFHFNSVETSFVGAASSFPIAVGSSKVENLGSIQLFGSFVPNDERYPFGGFMLQAMANGSYQSYFASVFSGVNF